MTPTEARPSTHAATPTLTLGYLEEPPLEFAGGRQHVDPIAGITIFGPRSLDDNRRHPLDVRVGLVGSGRSIESAVSWLDSCLDGVPGDGNLPDFPGFKPDRGFYTQLCLSASSAETVTQSEIQRVAAHRLLKDRFEEALALVSDKVRILAQKDNAPHYIILAIPDELLAHCKTVDYRDRDLGLVHRDFRRAIKAEAMAHGIPTQILLQRTSEAAPDARDVDHKSRCAWNFFTGLYFKLGGIPWSPLRLIPGTCYVGVSFYRPLGNTPSTLRTSVAQAFDEHGEGLVLRGQDFHWDESRDARSPHLDAAQARDLIDLVLRRYEAEVRQSPARVVLHKSSEFWPAELEGFRSALGRVRQFDLLTVTPTSHIRLLRGGKYPPLRGTLLDLGQERLLYTTGFIPALNVYPHGHVPSPLLVQDHIGDTPLRSLLEDLLVLTKMNWNSASFAGLMPITLRFSRLVGAIMSEIPAAREPLPQFKFYM